MYEINAATNTLGSSYWPVFRLLQTGQSEMEDLTVPTLETSNMQLTKITIKSSSKCLAIVRKNDIQPRILHSGKLSIKCESTVSTFSHTWSQFYLHTQPFSRSYWKVCPGHSRNTYFYTICAENRGVSSDCDLQITPI